MKHVQFYLLNPTNNDSSLSAEEIQACELSASAWKLGKRVLIACETEQQALRIDEALWTRDHDSFTPHNLSGEITTYPTPIEITWGDRRNAQHRDLLISLQTKIPKFVNSFQHIIEFVPTEDEAKAQARERYKQYRQMGWQLTMENA